jgi:hypothetical protein
LEQKGHLLGTRRLLLLCCTPGALQRLQALLA